MKSYLRKQVDWPQAFPTREYAERRQKVRTALSAKGIDAIYVTTPANLTYLTGYDMIWYHTRNLTGLLIRADSDQTVDRKSTRLTPVTSASRMPSSA